MNTSSAVKALLALALVGVPVLWSLWAFGLSGSRADGRIDYAILRFDPSMAFAQGPGTRPGCFDVPSMDTQVRTRLRRTLATAISPTGRYRVFDANGPRLKGSGAGFFIEDLTNGRKEFWEGPMPWGWAADSDTLFVADDDGHLATLSDLDAAPVPLAAGPPRHGAELAAVIDGFIFHHDGRNRAWIREPGGTVDALDLPHMVDDFGVTCGGAGACIPFVEHELPLETDGRPLRFLVASIGGQEVRFRIDGWDLDFIGIAPDASAAFALARRDAGRLLYKVAGDGTVTPVPGQADGRDVRFAVMGADGTVAAIHPFPSVDHADAMFQDGMAEQLWRVTPLGIRLIERQQPGQPTHLRIVGTEDSLIGETASGCRSNAVRPGLPLKGPGDGMAQPRGYLHRPQTRPTGVVVYFRGGNYEPFPGIADAITEAFIDAGFAVVEVEARNVYGYGPADMTPAAGARWRISAADAWTLLDRLTGTGLLPQDLPRFIVGQSSGTRPAVAALSALNHDWRGGMLISMACDADLQEVLDAPHRVQAPSTVITLRQLGQDRDMVVCAARIPRGRPVFAVHGEEDVATPPGGLRRLLKVNPDADFVVRWLSGVGHSLPAEDITQSVRQAIAHWTATPAAGTTGGRQN